MNETKLHANGLTFSAFEQGKGPVVLCLHGFPDSNRTYRAQLPFLAGLGYRVIAPLNRGYEPSSQPRNGDYHIVRMAEDVLGWMDDLGVEKAHIVGHDWGAVIGYAVAALAPRRLMSLTTMAVPHLQRMKEGVRQVPKQAINSWYTVFFQLRGIADIAVAHNDFAFIDKLWRNWSPGFTPSAVEMEALKAIFRQPGVAKAALEYYRAFANPFSPAARDTQKLLFNRIAVPTLALTGANDGCMDTRLYDVVMRTEDFPHGLRVKRIEKAGHFLHLEQPGLVNHEISQWLTEWS